MRAAEDCKASAMISYPLVNGSQPVAYQLFDGLREAGWDVGKGVATSIVGGEDVIGIYLSVTSENVPCFTPLEKALWSAGIPTRHRIEARADKDKDRISIVVGPQPAS